MANGITITGLGELQARIRNAPANISRLVSIKLKDGAQAIAGEAKQRAPGDQGFLRNLIGSSGSGLEYEVTSAADYSAFLEFGTGEKVEIPAGLEEYAAQFKGDFSSGTLSQGSGLTFKEAIFAWCERHGIDKDLWYAIYVSIGIHGIEAQPFFFPAVARQEPIIIANVKKALEAAL